MNRTDADFGIFDHFGPGDFAVVDLSNSVHLPAGVWRVPITKWGDKDQCAQQTPGAYSIQFGGATGFCGSAGREIVELHTADGCLKWRSDPDREWIEAEQPDVSSTDWWPDRIRKGSV